MPAEQCPQNTVRILKSVRQFERYLALQREGKVCY